MAGRASRIRGKVARSSSKAPSRPARVVNRPRRGPPTKRR